MRLPRTRSYIRRTLFSRYILKDCVVPDPKIAEAAEGADASERLKTREKAILSRALPLALVLSMACAGLAAVNRIPRSDEGGFSSSAWNLGHRGFMGATDRK